MVLAENPNVKKEACTIEIYLRVLVVDLLGELNGLPFIVSEYINGRIRVHCIYLGEDVVVDVVPLLLHLLATDGGRRGYTNRCNVMRRPWRGDGGRRRRGDRRSVGGS